jgi:hypothetical protein
LWLVVAVATIAVIVVVASIMALQSLRLRYARVVPRGFEDYSTFTSYVAEIYVEDKLARRLYVRIPKPGLYPRLLISIGVVGAQAPELKSLEVEVVQPPARPRDLAWISTSIARPVEFYRNGSTVIWRCIDLGGYGVGTLTLEFVPTLDTDFSSCTIHVKAVMEHDGVSYLVDHAFTIP